jgi:hypothetical protein
LWTAHLKTNRLHDARTARRPVLADDSQQSWQRVIGPEESVIVRDSNSGDIILVVIREFHSANLAPRQGNYAINYAGFTHNEHNAHEYCYSFTKSRHEPTSQEYGNHFYLSDTAIKVESVGNSVVIWRGKDWYGTTLLNVRPDTLGDEGSFSQVGWSITTSGTLFKAVQKMREMNHPGFSEETGFDIDLEHTDTE